MKEGENTEGKEEMVEDEYLTVEQVRNSVFGTERGK